MGVAAKVATCGTTVQKQSTHGPPVRSPVKPRNGHMYQLPKALRSCDPANFCAWSADSTAAAIPKNS